METYTFEVKLLVQVQSYSKSDAEEALEDHLGPGPDAGIEIVDCEHNLISVVA